MRRLATNMTQVMRRPATIAAAKTTTMILPIGIPTVLVAIGIADISQLLTIVTTAVTMGVVARAMVLFHRTAIKAAMMTIAAIMTARHLVTQAAGLQNARILRKVR